jgi:hypothetical protein
MPQLVLGRLRRDLMVLGTVNEGDNIDARKLAEDAVAQGRAAETWVIDAIGYFSETEHNWQGIDAGAPLVGAFAPASVPALNPNNGADGIDDRPQESLAASDQEAVSLRTNIERAAEEGPKGPETGLADRLHSEAQGAGTAGTRAAGPLAGAGHVGGASEPKKDVEGDASGDQTKETQKAPAERPQAKR